MSTVWSQNYAHPSQWDQQFELMTMPQMVEASVARKPDAPICDFMGRRYTYAQTWEVIQRVAAGLQARGVTKGTRVGLFLPNTPHYIAAYYGAMLAGATVVNFSPLYTVEELAAQAEDSGTQILFTLSAVALLPNALAVLDRSGIERLIVGQVAGVLPAVKSALFRMFKRSESTDIPDRPDVERFSSLINTQQKPTPVAIDALNDVALIQYTGGTTGTPKGAKLTHQCLTANARQVNLIDNQPGAVDRIMGVLPFFHVFANTCVLNRTVLNGGEVVMLPRFDAGQTLAAINRTKPTAMPGVPTMYQALLDHADIGKTNFSALRICISGGAPMPAELRTEFVKATGAQLVEGYGLTESSGVVACNPYDGTGKPGTIGQPVPGTDVRLVDKEDPTKPAPDGEPGEIVVRGPQIMAGYWNRPEADGDSLMDGWLRTGDVGVIDADGYIRIVDRLKDMIAVGGFKVYPSVIESVLYQHPAIRDALVIGMPDARLGETPVAYVTLEPDAEPVTAEALKSWLNGQVGKHERVTGVVIRADMPKTMIGKLDRKALRAEAGV